MRRAIVIWKNRVQTIAAAAVVQTVIMLVKAMIDLSIESRAIQSKPCILMALSARSMVTWHTILILTPHSNNISMSLMIVIAAITHR